METTSWSRDPIKVGAVAEVIAQDRQVDVELCVDLARAVLARLQTLTEPGVLSV